MTATPESRVLALYRDWACATGRDPDAPPTDADLDVFDRDVPVAVPRRRRRALAEALTGTSAAFDPGTVPPPPPASLWRSGEAWADLPRTLAAIPSAGWPGGLRGRRDAFLAVLAYAGFTRRAIRALTPEAITLDPAGQTPVTVAGRPVTVTEAAVTCPACAVTRWLRAVGMADRQGRAAIREALIRQRDATTLGHVCRAQGLPDDWEDVFVLCPAIDQHGWIADWRPMTWRAITATLAARQAIWRTLPLPPELAAAAEPLDPAAVDVDSGGDLDLTWRPPPATAAEHDPRDDEDLLDALDAQMDAADDLLARIEREAREFEENLARRRAEGTLTQGHDA